MSNRKDLPLVYSVYNTSKDTSRLTQPLSYMGYTVPVNFVTDFTSSLWWFRWLIPRFGPGNIAAVIHDYHYTKQPLSRSRADYVYREMLIACGVNRFNAAIRYYGLRLLGGSRYRYLGRRNGTKLPVGNNKGGYDDKHLL